MGGNREPCTSRQVQSPPQASNHLWVPGNKFKRNIMNVPGVKKASVKSLLSVDMRGANRHKPTKKHTATK